MFTYLQDFFFFLIWTVLKEQLVLWRVDSPYKTARIRNRKLQGNSILNHASSLFSLEIDLLVFLIDF